MEQTIIKMLYTWRFFQYFQNMLMLKENKNKKGRALTLHIHICMFTEVANTCHTFHRFSAALVEALLHIFTSSNP